MNREKPDRQMKTRELSLAAFSACVATVLLTVGFHFTFGEYFWYFCAGVAVSMPHTLRGKALAYTVSCILSTMMCPSWLFLCSYIFWLGPYTVLTACTDRFTRRFPADVIRFAGFFAGEMIVLWTTPMLFVQLSILDRAFVLPAVLIAFAVSIPAWCGYSSLFGKVSALINERINRQA